MVTVKILVIHLVDICSLVLGAFSISGRGSGFPAGQKIEMALSVVPPKAKAMSRVSISE